MCNFHDLGTNVYCRRGGALPSVCTYVCVCVCAHACVHACSFHPIEWLVIECMISKTAASKMDHIMWNTHFKKAEHFKRGGAYLNVICTKLTEEFDVSMQPLTKLYEIETQYLKSSLHADHRRGMIISLLSAWLRKCPIVLLLYYRLTQVFSVLTKLPHWFVSSASVF
jgi:hypothetical protein